MRFKTFLEIGQSDDNNLLMQLRRLQLPIPWNWDQMSPTAKAVHVYWASEQQNRQKQAVDKAQNGVTQVHANTPPIAHAKTDQWNAWIGKGKVENWSPKDTKSWANNMMSNTDMLKSALDKLVQQIQLNSKDIESLKFYKVLVQTPQGFEINQQVFDRYHKILG